MNLRNYAFAALAAFALSISPVAQAADKGCSNATLRGTFSDRDSGWIYAAPPPAAPIPFAGVLLDTFDGNGNVTFAGTGSVGGNVSVATSVGTYKVNPDCTGTYTSTGGGLTIHAFFVISDSGNQLDIVITDPGTV